MNENITLEHAHSRIELTAGDDNVRLIWKSLDSPARSAPLAALRVLNRKVERQERTDRFEVLGLEHTAELNQGVRVLLLSRAYAIVFAVWVNLNDTGELEATVAPAEVEERRQEMFRVASIELLPGLLEATGDDRMLLPINCGVMTRPGDKPAVEDRFLIYGEQERWELLPSIPVCGVKGQGVGVMAMATGVPHDMYCHVCTDGNGRGDVSLYPMFRRQWIDPVDWALRRVVYTPVAAVVSLPVFAGHRLRQHVIEDHGKPTLKQREAESPVLAYRHRAYTMKLFHGVQRRGSFASAGGDRRPDDSVFVRTMTFPAAARQMHKLKAAGVERIEFQSVGWNPRGHDGAYPTLFPVEQRLGGKAGLRDMIETARELGFQISPHMNFKAALNSSPDLKLDHVVHDIWGEPKVSGEWGGGLTHVHWTPARGDHEILDSLHRLEQLGFNGMMYLDGMANPLWVNYHPQHRGSRRDFAEGTNRLLNLSRRVFGAVGTEMGYLYAAIHAHSPCYAGGEPWHCNMIRPEWPIARLVDEPVPVWQLAMHGLTTQENVGLGAGQTVRGVLFGEIPRDEWATEPGVMPLINDQRIARLKHRYHIMCERFGHLVTETLEHWQRNDDGSQTTRFSDGTEVQGHLDEQWLKVNGETIDLGVETESVTSGA